MGKAHTANKGEPTRERMCIVTRARAEEADLIRFVLDPSGCVVPDVKANLPGRGAWVSLNREVLAQAINRKAFTRAFKADAPIGGLDDLPERTQSIVRAHALGALGFARKAGLVVNGFAKVESALKSGKAYLVLNALDAGADGQKKISRLAGHFGVPVAQVFTHNEMGLALGQEHVIHAALLDGPGAVRFSAPIRRLEAFGLGQGASKDSGLNPTNGTTKRSTHREDMPVLGDKTAV